MNARFALPPMLMVLGLWGCSQPAPPVEPDAPTGSVRVKLELPDGKSRQVDIAEVRAGETVLSVMQRIPGIEFQGTGSTAIVTRIGDRSTSASEGWTFYVNDQWADRSPGVYQVEPGDTIHWRYGVFSP